MSKRRGPESCGDFFFSWHHIPTWLVCFLCKSCPRGVGVSAEVIHLETKIWQIPPSCLCWHMLALFLGNNSTFCRNKYCFLLLGSCSMATGLISVCRVTNLPITKGAWQKPRSLSKWKAATSASCLSQLAYNSPLHYIVLAILLRFEDNFPSSFKDQ